MLHGPGDDTMLTFSVNETNPIEVLRVEKAIQDNIQYFKKFNGVRWEEAVNKTFEVAIQHVKSEYETLDPYIKTLARTILKEQEKETPMDTVTEDGEVSFPFLKLTSHIDEDRILTDRNEIMKVYKELYLKYEEDFLKLKVIFKKDDAKFSKYEVVKNEEIKREIAKLRMNYDVSQVYDVLYEFFKSLPKYSKAIENATMKIIDMRSKEQEFLSYLPDIPMIVDEKGNLYDIDKLNLSMEKDPDTFKWDVITQTSCDIVRIDYSPLINYMYQQVFVPKGVFTKHIYWCDDMYRVATPGGKYYVNIDREKFINLVKIELIAHLVNNRVNTIIAISPDYIYVKPVRMISYDTIRLNLFTGKVIDLPIEIYLKKRK